MRNTAAITLAFIAAAALPAATQERGAYLGLNIGLTAHGEFATSLIAQVAPLTCYASPTPPGCEPMPVESSVTAFSPSTGFTGGLSAGYDFGILRLEGEYRMRQHGEDIQPIVRPDGTVLDDRTGLWSEHFPPSEIIAGMRAHQLFFNALVDFENDSRWTPYVGAGAGVAHTSMHYARRFVAKTYAEGYAGPTDIDLAGTFNTAEQPLIENVAGYQIVGGLDYALSDRATIGVSAHRAAFRDMEEVLHWDLGRSRRAVLVDGSAATGTITLESPDYWAVTLSMRYLF